jgi:hypothetical protein
MEAAPAAIPVNPKRAAMIAIIKNIAAHLSIEKFLVAQDNTKLICFNYCGCVLT